MLKFRLPSRKVSSNPSPATTNTDAANGSSASSLEATNPAPSEDLPVMADTGSAALPTPPEVSVTSPTPMKKGRRKSYGGIRAMLGKTKEDPPPLPPTGGKTPEQSPSKPSRSPTKPIYINSRSSDSQSSLGAALYSGSAPNSPSAIPEPRVSTSSLRPFPFLNMRRKSSNTSANQKPTFLGLTAKGDTNKGPGPPSPGPWNARTASHRLNSYSNSKKAQSVDDLSQFGLLPDRDRARQAPRRSAEFERSPKLPLTSRVDASGLHSSLDRIGELAGTLAAIPGQEDKQPRLSNPRGMRSVYGSPLQDLFWRDGDAFPLLVDVMVGLVEKHGLDQQGIYRIPGEKRIIEELQAVVDEKGVKGVDIWKFTQREVHNVTGALKLFLRELPGGAVPFAHYDDFIEVSALVNDDDRTTQLRRLLRQIPEPNRILMERLVRHFVRVVDHAAANSMLAHNIAIVFAPSLFRSVSEQSNPFLSMQNIGKASAVVRHLVIHADAVFSTEPEPDVDSSEGTASVASSSVLTPDMVGSSSVVGKGGDDDMEQLVTPVAVRSGEGHLVQGKRPAEV